MKIFLITDIHYGKNTNYEHFGGLNYINHFGELVPHLKDKIYNATQECDLVINMGDLIHQTKSRDEDKVLYREATKVLDTGKLTKHVVGNHDMANLKREDIANIINEEKIYYSFDFDGYHHIVLDGNRDGITRPEPFRFDQDQIDWLEKDLKNTELKTIIYCHFPIYDQDVSKNLYFKEAPRDQITPLQSDNVRKILEDSGKILAVFNGHTHFIGHQNLNGIDYYTVGSFAENDGKHKPTTEYAIVTVNNGNLKLEIKKLN